MCFAQITFQKTFGGTDSDVGRSVVQTSDGGFIVTGYTWGFGNGGIDVYLIRADSNGNTLWTKTYGGTSDDVGYSVEQTADGGFIVSGFTESFGNGNRDVYLIRTDANGNMLWTKTFGGTLDEEGYSVRQTNGGGFIVTGYTDSFGGSFYQVYLVNTDANGNILWTSTYGDGNGYSVQQTSDGGFIATGYTGNVVYLIRTDATGNQLWTKTFGGPTWVNAEGNMVKQTSDGGFIIVGYRDTVTVPNYIDHVDVYLIRTDANGNALWAKTFGGLGNEFGYSVEEVNDGGFVVAGRTWSFGFGGWDVYLFKTDANGSNLWSKTFGGTSDDFCYSAQQTSDGGYVLTGFTENFGSGLTDVYLIKTDSNGNSYCNETSPNTIVVIPVTTVSAGSTQTNVSTIVTSPATIVSTGGVESSLCSNAGIGTDYSINADLNIYPNPVQNKFYLETTSKNKDEIEINLVDVYGTQAIENVKSNNQLTQITVSGLSDGIYFVRVKTEQGTATKKIIIQH